MAGAQDVVVPCRGGAPVERPKRLRPEALPAQTPSGPRGLAAVILTALIVYALCRYPLAPWPLAAALLAYAALLWRFPDAFLFVLPVVLPALDLGLWTGWMAVGESDLFVLVTLSVLLIRLPPERRDLLPSGVARWAILAIIAIWTLAAAIGLSSPLGAEPSDNPYLRPDNALRLAKSLAEATALLPFLIHRQRRHGDAVARFGLGMAAGLAAVTLAVLTERMLFASVLDFSGAYRVAGPFSSMRVGGGHIGAYAALALPFTLCLSPFRPRWLAAGLLGLACLAGGYTLAVTFARAAYAAGLAGMAVTGAAWLWARRRRSTVATLVVLAPVALMLAGLAAAAGLTGMRERFAETAPDYATRAGNWQAGLAARDASPLGVLFGLGLGTYQRAMLTRSAVNRPTDLMLRHDEAGAYVVMLVTTPFFLGQKITLPAGPLLRLTLSARPAGQPTTLGVLACDKVLLYADNCRGPSTPLPMSDQWQSLSVTLPTQGLGATALLGLLRRPVELSVFGSAPIEVRDISLIDDAGHALLANGDFAQGLDNWIFTDDSHVSWRMLNQYLMLFFEMGLLGLGAYLALAGSAIMGALRAASGGATEAAAVAGAITAFLVSGLSDNVLEAPRLAALFFLACFCGLIQRPMPSRTKQGADNKAAAEE